MGLATGVNLCLAELTMYFAEWMLPLAANDYGVGQSLVLGTRGQDGGSCAIGSVQVETKLGGVGEIR